MTEKKEIFIEIDESGILDEIPSKAKNKNYYFLTCSFIANKYELNEASEFHYREFIFNPEIKTEDKRQKLIDLATKIEKENIFYSICKIDKTKMNDIDYEAQATLVVSEYFQKLLIKLTKNNNLKVNIYYDAGQSKLTTALNLAINQFKKDFPNDVSLNYQKSPNHGFSDFIASIEKVKFKNEHNTLGNYEKELYEDGSLLTIEKKIKDKNLDEITFDNFEKLIYPKEAEVEENEVEME